MNRMLRSPLSRVFQSLAPLHFKPPFSSFTTQPGSPTSSEYLNKFEATPAPLESKAAPQNLFSGSLRVPKTVIYWDTENYEVPHYVRPEDVAGNIRSAMRKHPAIQGNIFNLSAYGDFKRISRDTRKGLYNAGVRLINIPRRTKNSTKNGSKNGSKNTVIYHILKDVFLFVFDNPPPATIVLIAELVDVAIELGVRGYTTILVISPNVEVSSMPWNALTFVCVWQSVVSGVAQTGTVGVHLNSIDGMLMPYYHHLCGGTYISNTREAKAFALLSEEGIAKGVRRITAVTTDLALEAMKRAELPEQEVIDASKDDIYTLEKAEVTKAKKKTQAENLKKAIKIATEEAEVAISGGRSFSVSYLDVGLDAAVAREAVQKAVLKGIPVMVFSKDEDANKALVYAGVPPKADKYKESDLHEWLTSALEPLKGNGGKPKCGLCSGQGKDASGLEEAMNVAKKFAELKLS